MRKLSLFLTLVLAALVGAAGGQAQAPVKASVTVKTKMTIGGKKVELSRKRFYLFRGGLDTNTALANRIKSASYTSRDCFYCSKKASPEYIAWLRLSDCESPYCRDITADDVAKVPEFKAAYQKGLTAYKNKTDVARTWVTTNMPPDLRDGYYLQRKKLADTIFADLKPAATVMTDASSQQAIFIDLLLSGTSEKFLISNVLPFEIGGKSYVWVCEVTAKAGANSFILPPSETTAHVKTCDVVVKDLPKCENGSCGQ
ncbi:MAG: hypothetical protein ACJ73D_05000 [Pyrinomonadaceae bacterium]